MPDLLLIVLGTVLVNHFVLGGLINVKSEFDDKALATVAFATGIVMLMTTALLFGTQRWLLSPLSAGYLQLLVAIAAAGGATSLFFLCIERSPSRKNHKPLVMSNGIVLTLALQHAVIGREWPATTAIAVSVAIAFGILLLAFTELLSRLEQSDIPPSFRGAPIALISAGLAALALLGLTGLLPD